MPAVKNVGEPCAGEPHARIDGGREETRDQSAMPREPGRLSPTRPLPAEHRPLLVAISTSLVKAGATPAFLRAGVFAADGAGAAAYVRK
jgi:hypothetical protein